MMDEWHAEWGSEWQEDSAAEPSRPQAWRIGKRIIDGDLLFSQCPDVRIYVPRDPDDDFTRIPVPDSFCRPLITGPGFSSTVTDVYRYRISGDVDTRSGWRCSQRTGKIELSHPIYHHGDFVLQVESRIVSKQGSYLRSGLAKSFDGVACCLNISGRLVIAGTGWMEHYMPRLEWQSRYNGPAVLFLLPSVPEPIYMDMIPIPDNVRVIRYRIQRQGPNIRFLWEDTNGVFIPTSWNTIGTSPATMWFEGVQVHGGI